MECPETAILDRQIPSVGRRGIALSKGGGFSFAKDGISMQGHIGERAGSGHLQGRVDGCEMTGVVWERRQERRVACRAWADGARQRARESPRAAA